MGEELLRMNVPGKHSGADPFACDARELATRLLATASCRPGSDEADALFEQLQRQRRNGHWVTTQGNAWAVLALHRYLGGSSKHQIPSSREASSTKFQVAGALMWGNQREPFELASVHGLF